MTTKQLPQPSSEQLSQLQEVLYGKPGQESPFTSDEIEDFVVSSLLAAAADPTLVFPPEAEELLGRFSRRIGVPDNASDEEAVQHTVRYFEQHPVNRVLLQRFGDTFRASMSASVDDARKDRANTFLGAQRTSVPAPRYDTSRFVTTLIELTKSRDAK